MRNFLQYKAREVKLFERQFLASTSCHYKIQIWPLGNHRLRKFYYTAKWNWKNIKAENEIENKNVKKKLLVLNKISLVNWLELNKYLFQDHFEGTTVYRYFPMKTEAYYKWVKIAIVPCIFAHFSIILRYYWSISASHSISTFYVAASSSVVEASLSSPWERDATFSIIILSSESLSNRINKEIHPYAPYSMYFSSSSKQELRMTSRDTTLK